MSYNITTERYIADGEKTYRRDLRSQYAQFSIDVEAGETYLSIINSGYSYLISTEPVASEGVLTHPEKVKWIVLLITSGIIIKVPKNVTKLYFTLEGNPINVADIPNVIWVSRVKNGG